MTTTMEFRKWISISAGLCAMLATGCNSGPRGTYSDTPGSTVLDLKSGGKANLTYMGDVADCTYTTSGKQLTLNCPGTAGTLVFTIHDNDTLTGPPGSFIPALRKQK